MDSGSNGSRSRASSLEKEADSPLLSSGSGEDSDAAAGKKGRGSRGGSRGSKKKFTKKKSTPRVDGRLSKVSFYTDLVHFLIKCCFLRIIENNKIDTYFGSGCVNKGQFCPAGLGKG